MQDNMLLTYEDVFETLQKIIIERQFGEIITFEGMIRDHQTLLTGDQEFYNNEIDLIELSAIYIFCIMLKKDEEDIFPFLREYVLRVLSNAFFEYQENNVQAKLANAYNLDNVSIEQRYLYLLSAIGFNAFNSDIGLHEVEEIDDTVFKKMFQKFFLIEYDKFSTEVIKGLCLLYKYKEYSVFNFDPVTELFFETVLKRIAFGLVNYQKNKECCENSNLIDRKTTLKIEEQVEKMNFV